MPQFVNAGPGRVLYSFACPNLMLIGRQNWTKTKLPRSTGTLLPERMAFHFQIKGQQTIWIGQQPHRVRGGEVFITFPGETSSIAQEKGMFYWLQMWVPCHGFLLDVYGSSDDALKEALLHLQPRQFRSSALIGQLLHGIHAQAQQEETPLFTGWFQIQIANLLFEVVRCAQRATRAPHSLQEVTRYIEEQVLAHRAETLSIPTLATRAKLSITGFEKKFKSELGMTPSEYVMRLMIDEAKRLLVRGLNVTEVAMELNFSSSQHFARTFKQYIGQTPSEFQQSTAQRGQQSAG